MEYIVFEEIINAKHKSVFYIPCKNKKVLINSY